MICTLHQVYWNYQVEEELGGACSTNGEVDCIQVTGRGKRPLGRPRQRWMDNIKMDLAEIGLGRVDWIGLAQDRYRWRALVNVVMNTQVP
jgi:hypothetical protein